MSVGVRCTLLGTGSSGGVPRVGGDWGACDPNEPKNRRLSSKKGDFAADSVSVRS